MDKLPKIALGAWAWGNDGTFGGSLTVETLRPIFEAGQTHGLNLWDTAYAYGMGTSEKVLDAVKAANISLTADEAAELENIADSLNLNVIRFWEKEMK